MTERSEIHTIEPEDQEDFLIHASKALNEVKAVLPENLHCLLLCAVTKDNEVKIGILGSDMDIAKMLMTVTTVVRNDVVQTNSPSNPNNEVPQ